MSTSFCCGNSTWFNKWATETSYFLPLLQTDMQMNHSQVKGFSGLKKL